MFEVLDIGDEVRQPGGPKMHVHEKKTETIYVCTWFINGKKQQFGDFHIKNLRKANDDDGPGIFMSTILI